MRENMGLYQGKRKDNGKWTSGYLFSMWETAYICWGMTNGVPNMEEVIPESVGQYTGFTDKNGNGRWIFEGNIIHCVKHRYDYVGVVCWSGSSFCLDCSSHNGHTAFFDLYDIYEESTDVIVIGNVYDNPELLNKQPKQKKEIWANALLSDGEIMFWHTGYERASVNDFFKDFIYAGYGDKYVETHKLELVKKKFEVDEDDICANNRVFEVDARNFYRQFRISPDCKGEKPY